MKSRFARQSAFVPSFDSSIAPLSTPRGPASLASRALEGLATVGPSESISSLLEDSRCGMGMPVPRPVVLDARTLVASLVL